MKPCAVSRRLHIAKLVGGFTLTEVLMTVTLIAIMAGVALPRYTRTLERSYLRETETLLLAIYAGEQIFFTANDRYSGVWAEVFMDDPNLASIPVTFTLTGCAPAPCTTFTATATRSGGGCGGRTRTINQARAMGGTWPACPAL